jgi:hypothetical protein
VRDMLKEAVVAYVCAYVLRVCQRTCVDKRGVEPEWPVSVSSFINGKGKAVPSQAWSGPEGSRKLRFPDFMTTAQDDGNVVSLTHRPPLPQEIHLVLVSVRG